MIVSSTGQYDYQTPHLAKLEQLAAELAINEPDDPGAVRLPTSSMVNALLNR